MALLVPVACDRNGVTVLPSCNKSQSPFTCIECEASLLVKQGEKSQWHFAHASSDASGCSGGGESLQHRAAKMIITEYITKINFVQVCSKGEHEHVRRYKCCKASQEFRYDGRHSADVAVFSEDDKLRAIVEVKFSHATTGEALDSRVSHVGIEDMWEVDATRVIKAQSKLHSAKRSIDLSATNGTKCQPCKLKRAAAKLRRVEARKKWKARKVEYEALERNAAERKLAALNAINAQRAWLETLPVMQRDGTIIRPTPKYGFAEVNWEAR